MKIERLGMGRWGREWEINLADKGPQNFCSLLHRAKLHYLVWCVCQLNNWTEDVSLKIRGLAEGSSLSPLPWKKREKQHKIYNKQRRFWFQLGSSQSLNWSATGKQIASFISSSTVSTKYFCSSLWKRKISDGFHLAGSQRPDLYSS